MHGGWLGAGGLLALALAVAVALVPIVASPAHGDGPAATELRGLEQAKAVLAEIERLGGEPPPGHVGGRAFHNRERRLPPGDYREYDVSRKVPGRPRDAQRIVIEQRTGKAYYTRDHYRSFVPLN